MRNYNVCFTIAGEVQAKQRPRFNTNEYVVRVYMCGKLMVEG